MKINTFNRVLLFLPVYFLLTNHAAVAQLAVEAGTTWVSDSSTHTVLDNMGVRYYSTPILLGSTFEFSGARDVFIESNTTPRFYRISVNTTGHQLILKTDIDVSNKVSFRTGLFHLNNHLVNLAPAAYIENEQETSRFTDTSGGSIHIAVHVDHSNSINPGNLGAVFSSPDYYGNLDIVRGHRRQTVIGSRPNSIARYYRISTDDKGAIDATLRVNYFDAEKNGLDENTFELWQENSAGVWKNKGAAGHNAIINWVEQNGFNDFGTFTLAIPDSLEVALPPPGLSGIWKLNVAVLTWTTASETNNFYFQVERKYNTDTGFVKLTFVPSKHADGNANSPTSYQYTDGTANSSKGDIGYRIKQVAKDGSTMYSNEILLQPADTATAVGFIMMVYPTLSPGTYMNIQVGHAPATNMQVQIFDVYGKQLLLQTLPYVSQPLILPFLPHGFYRMVIRSGSLKYQSTFIK